MPVNKDALRRYYIIDRCLRNNMHPFPSKEFILSKIREDGLHISIDTLNKDFRNFESHFGVRIQYNRIRKGYQYDDPNFSIKGNPLTEDDKWLMDFATATMHAYGHSHMMLHFESLVNKLVTGSEMSRSNTIAGTEYIQVEGSDFRNGYQWLYPLYQSIVQRKVQKIHYKPFGRNTKAHTLSPYLLKQYRSRWYVIGWSAESKNTLVFALDRIQGMLASKTNYYQDAAFDADEYFRYSFGITHQYDLEPIRVHLRFTNEMKPYIMGLPLHHSQQLLAETKDGFDIQLYVKDTFELRQMILGYGASVTVIGPEELKFQIQEELKETLHSYL